MEVGRHLARSAAFIGLPALLQELNVDEDSLSREAGVPDAAFHNPDIEIEAHLIGRVYDLIIARTGVRDLALRVVEHRHLTAFGVLGLALSHQTSLDACLRLLEQYMHLQSQGVRVRTRRNEEMIEVIIFPPVTWKAASGHYQAFSAEFTVGSVFRVLSECAGFPLTAERVSFVHRQGADVSAYRRIFGTIPKFDESWNGFAIRAKDARAQLAREDRAMSDEATKMLKALGDAHSARPLPELVAEEVLLQLPHGRPSSEWIAAKFGMSERTLTRRLREDGSGLLAIVNDMRRRLAISYCRDSSASLTSIGLRLGFSNASAFSHWFQMQIGSTPSHFRRTHATADSGHRR